MKPFPCQIKLKVYCLEVKTMRKFQFFVTAVFLIVTVVFLVFVSYDRLMLDHTAPQIICDGVPLYVSANATDTELCSGLTAYDDVDGDLTNRIIVRKISKLTGANTATIYYAVFDSASNYCTFTRTVTYTDYCKPHFALSEPLCYKPNSTLYLSDRLTAHDVIDGNISGRIRVSSDDVSISEPGQYDITLLVTNSSGDTSLLTLPVLIESRTELHPTIRLTEYLRYVPIGSELTEEELRSMIVSVRETSNGVSVAPEKVTISGTVDTEKFGSYTIIFSYENSRNLVCNVMLTVVVE